MHSICSTVLCVSGRLDAESRDLTRCRFYSFGKKIGCMFFLGRHIIAWMAFFLMMLAAIDVHFLDLLFIGSFKLVIFKCYNLVFIY